MDEEHKQEAIRRINAVRAVVEDVMGWEPLWSDYTKNVPYALAEVEKWQQMYNQLAQEKRELEGK